MRPTFARLGALALLLPLALAVTLRGQQAGVPGPVTSQELVDGLKADGSNWLTFGGNYANHRYSPLTQITPENVSKLQPRWTFQTNTLGNFETTTLLRDNVLYATDLASEKLPTVRVCAAPKQTRCAITDTGLVVWNGKAFETVAWLKTWPK